MSLNIDLAPFEYMKRKMESMGLKTPEINTILSFVKNELYDKDLDDLDKMFDGEDLSDKDLEKKVGHCEGKSPLQRFYRELDLTTSNFPTGAANSSRLDVVSYHPKTSLSYYYGVMNSAKTAMMLMNIHNIQSTQKPILIKPTIDTRSITNAVSRTGLTREVDIHLSPTDNIAKMHGIFNMGITHIFVDEAQFLTVDQVNQLRFISQRINVVCFGLKTDYTGSLFPASKRLIEISDTIKEIKTRCSLCNRKAVMTAKFTVINDIKVFTKEECETEVVDIGGEEKYQSMCWICYNKC
jgi:thymidine kinase